MTIITGGCENSRISAANKTTLARSVHLTDTVVFVDGIVRTGKGMLGPILSSFERVEIERYEEIIEYVGVLYRMAKIERDAAIALLKTQTDTHLFYSMIGRNTNFRFSDHSSVWRNPIPFRYIRRLVARDGDSVIERIEKERPIYQNQTHDQLANFELYYEAFGDRLRIVEMIRHPVDLIDSWMRKGWGDRFGKDPLAMTFCIGYQGQDLPYYAVGWEELYLVSTPLGRVVRMIESLWQENQKVYCSLSAEERRHVLIISFENFVQQPTPYLPVIADFLGTKITRYTSKALKRENCPRLYSIEARQQKQRRIESQASSDERKILKRLIEEYETLASAVAIRDG